MTAATHTPLTHEEPSDDGQVTPGGPDQPAGRPGWPVFLVPTVTALSFVLTGLGHRQMWRDETATWWASSLSYHDLGRLIQHIDVVFTIYYGLMHLWIGALGTSPAVLRLPSALAMGLSAGLVGLIGHRLFSWRTGMLAGLLFALLPTVTRYGQEARPYAFATLFALIATLLLLRTLERPSLRDWTLYAAAVSGIGFSHLVSLSVLAAHAVLVIAAKRRGDRIAAYAFAAATTAGLSAVVPMLAQGNTQSGQISWNVTTTADLIAYPQTLFGASTTQGYAIIGLAVLGLAVLALLPASRSSAAMLAVWAVLPPVLTYVTANRLHLFLPRYLLFTLPAWMLLVAALLTRLTGTLNQRARGGSPAKAVLGAVVVFAVTVVFGWQVLPSIHTAKQDLPQEPDYVGAARLVLQGELPGDGIAFTTGMAERRVMAYDLRGHTQPNDVLMRFTPQQNGGYNATECEVPVTCLVGTKRLWLISTATNGNPFSTMSTPAEATALQKEFTIVHTTTLNHVAILLLQRK
jgi:mannosyltransferase